MAIREANERVKWKDRVPFAHWKGNSYVSLERRNLMKCNFSDKYDPMVRLYDQVCPSIFIIKSLREIKVYGVLTQKTFNSRTIDLSRK